MKTIDCLDSKNKLNFSRIAEESRIYDVVTGDFIAKALFKFQFQNYLCFVMEYLPGGDFAALLETIGRFTESTARFYLAEIVLAIEHLHQLSIIHRDLKPENILLSETGHIKLTDFGLS